LNETEKIFDGKDFQLDGPKGCNMCAGVISNTLRRRLIEEEILLPKERIQHRVKGYFFQTETDAIYLRQPAGEEICTVFRGNGPRKSFSQDVISFDDFLLESVVNKGVRVVKEHVVNIEYGKKRSSPLTITTRKGNSFKIDLLVGAFGLNSNLAGVIKKLQPAYIAPRSVKTLQAELLLGESLVNCHFGKNIHLYSLKLKQIDFVALIPKKNYITISMIGQQDVSRSDLDAFLNHPLIASKISEISGQRKYCCTCRPKIMVREAKKPYAHRVVLIGDASYARYFKNGIESAFFTAERAAYISFFHGISEGIYQNLFEKWAKGSIVADNLYGKPFFMVNRLINHSKFLSKVHVATAMSGRTPLGGAKLKEILWIFLTGDQPYKAAFFKLFSFSLHRALLYHTFKIGLDSMQSLFTDVPVARSPRGSNLLGSGNSRIAIVGGGPAGTSCALRLIKQARRMGRKIEVYIFEGKNFKQGPQYNQCVGILSPPIREMLENSLGIPFPDHLIQREISGYALHSQKNSLELDDPEHPSYAVRRVTFDNYMLECAEKAGATVIRSRVTDIEITPEEVVIYSDKRNLMVDVLVGAFGLDDGACRLFERNTPYKQPRFLESVITKMHPSAAFMENFGTRIHAFLPNDKTIEFGAISPKHNHITINIAGKSVQHKDLVNFLARPEIKKILPEKADYRELALYFYKGRFPLGPAKNFFGHRYVIIGDAAGLVRTFKGKGINSGCLTGIRAADTILEDGIDKEGLSHYVEKCSDILSDFKYGLAFRKFALFSKNSHLWPHIIDLAKRDSMVRTALFDAVSGHKSYGQILFEDLHYKNWLETGKNYLKLLKTILLK